MWLFSWHESGTTAHKAKNGDFFSNDTTDETTNWANTMRPLFDEQQYSDVKM